MNTALILAIALILFWLSYRFYARYISRVFKVDDSIPTPAIAMEDGVDYVPTKSWVVFGHHFASIAGAGPIVGPTVAIVYGWVPALIWIVLGSILIGSVHDFAALLTSLKEKGRSIAELARDALGTSGFFLLISFTLIIILLVCAAFLQLTATALTSMYPLSDMGLPASQTLFGTVVDGEVTKVIIGGIASTSVIIITAAAPVVGWLLYRKKMNPVRAAIIATVVALGSVLIGIYAPLRLPPAAWMIVLSIYTLFAAGIPVWILLQPRDFVNSFILYVGIALLVLGTLAAGFKGVPMQMDAMNIAAGQKQYGPVWPMLFILIACGAVSGFHALVAGGTSSKQLEKESDARRVGYGAMLLEGLLALGVVIAIAAGLGTTEYMRIMFPTIEGAKQNPILAFSVGMGSLLDKSIGLPMHFGTIFGVVMVEGFIATTLDTAVRLNRYLFEELWNVLFLNPPAFMKSYLFNAGLAVLIMLSLAWNNAFKALWPLFGAGNQLLAALTLIAISVWLMQRNKPMWFTLVPGAFMLCTTVAALVWVLIDEYIPDHKTILIVADILMLALSAGSVIISIKSVIANIGKSPLPSTA